MDDDEIDIDLDIDELDDVDRRVSPHKASHPHSLHSHSHSTSSSSSSVSSAGGGGVSVEITVLPENLQSFSLIRHATVSWYETCNCSVDTADDHTRYH
jgi:hypothetical protein